MKKGPANRLTPSSRTGEGSSSQEDLRSASRRLTRLIETLQVGILVEDEHRRIVLVNETFCRMFGIPAPPESLVGADCTRSAEQSKHLFADPEKFVSDIDVLLADRRQTTEEILPLRDGRSFERDYIPIYVDDTYRGHMWVYRDVSQRVREQHALTQLTEQQQVLLETARSFQSTFAPQQITTIIAESLERLFPYDTLALYMREPEEEMLRPVVVRGTEWISDDPDAWRVPSDKGIIGAVLSSGKAENVTDAQDDPRTYYPDKEKSPDTEHLLVIPLTIDQKVEGAVILNRLSDPPFAPHEFELSNFLVSFACLALENGRLFELMTQRETEKVALLEAIPDMLIRFSTDGTVHDLQASEQHTLIAPPRKLIGKHLSSVLPRATAEKALTQAKAALKTSALMRMEYQVELTSGFATYELRIAPLNDTEVIALASDITLRKKAEQSLVEAKRMVEESLKAKEEFFARMSHEIRTPMNGVMGLTNLLLDTELTDNQREMLRTLKLSADNLLVIINDILDLAKLDAGKLRFTPEPFSLYDLLDSIRQAALPTAESKGIELRIEIARNVPPALIGDALRLTQVLQNLVSNALKFTDQGSVSIVVTAGQHDDESRIMAFEVQDTGFGIPPTALPQLFETFRQFHDRDLTAVRGTGLGLAIIKQLTELQGGTVEVDSELEKGTTFTVRIPFGVTSTDEIAAAPQTSASELSLLKGVRILLAEDDAVNQVVATRTLNQWSVDVTVCHDGAEAVRTLEKGAFDLVLMDIQMPVLNGFEATRRIRAHENADIASIPIIAMTASVLDSAQDRVLDAGMNDYISKPFDPHMLHRKIRTALHIDAKGQRAERPRPTSSGLDLSYLIQLSAGDIGFLEMMVQLYKDESSLQIAQIREKARQGRWEDVGRAAHKLKPSIKMIGLKELEPHILRLEECGANEELRASFEEDFRRVEERCASSYLELDRIDLSSLLKGRP